MTPDCDAGNDVFREASFPPANGLFYLKLSGTGIEDLNWSRALSLVSRLGTSSIRRHPDRHSGFTTHRSASIELDLLCSGVLGFGQSCKFILRKALVSSEFWGSSVMPNTSQVQGLHTNGQGPRPRRLTSIRLPRTLHFILNLA